MAIRLAPSLCAVALGAVVARAKPSDHAGGATEGGQDGEPADELQKHVTDDDNPDYGKHVREGVHDGDYTKYMQGGGEQVGSTNHAKGDYMKYMPGGGEQGDYHKYMQGPGGQGEYTKYMQGGGHPDSQDGGPAESWHKYMGQGGQGDYTKYMQKYGGDKAMKYLEKYGGGQADYQKYVSRYSAMAGGDSNAAAGYAGKEASQKAAFQEAMKETYAQYIPREYAAMAEKSTAARDKGHAAKTAGGDDSEGSGQDYHKYIEKYWGQYANQGGSRGSAGDNWHKYVEKYGGKSSGHTRAGGSGSEDWKTYMYKYWGKYKHSGQHATESAQLKAPKEASSAQEESDISGAPVSAVLAAVEGSSGGAEESPESSGDQKAKAEAKATLHAINKYAAQYMPKDILKRMRKDLERKAGRDQIEMDTGSALPEAGASLEARAEATASTDEGETSGAQLSAVFAAVEGSSGGADEGPESSGDEKAKAEAKATLHAINKYAAQYMPNDILRRMREDLERKAGDDQIETDTGSAVPEAGASAKVSADATASSDEAEISGAPLPAVLAAVEGSGGAEQSVAGSGDEDAKEEAKATLHAINKYAAKYMPKDILKMMTEDLQRKAGEGQTETDTGLAVPEAGANDVVQAEGTPVTDVAEVTVAPVSAVLAAVEDSSGAAAQSKISGNEKAEAKATLHAINKYAAKYMPKDVLKRITDDLQRKASEDGADPDAGSTEQETGAHAQDSFEANPSPAFPTEDVDAAAQSDDLTKLVQGLGGAEGAVPDVMLLAVPAASSSGPPANVVAMVGFAMLGSVAALVFAVSGRRRRKNIDLKEGEAPFLLMA